MTRPSHEKPDPTRERGRWSATGPAGSSGSAPSAVDPYRAVRRNLPDVGGRVFGLGIGKAAIPMMDALAERVPLSGGLADYEFGHWRKTLAPGETFTTPVAHLACVAGPDDEHAPFS